MRWYRFVHPVSYDVESINFSRICLALAFANSDVFYAGEIEVGLSTLTQILLCFWSAAV